MNDSLDNPDSETDDHIWAEAVAPEPSGERTGIPELRDELAAAAAEWRRGTRRHMGALREFGNALTAIGEMVRDLHSASRQSVSVSPGAAGGSGLSDDWLTTLIDLSDRLARTAGAFGTAPPQASSWWPGARAALDAWRNAWATQGEALAILQSHMESLLARAGLERLKCAGAAFDPASMTAVEVVTDAGTPDHTVTAELLGGWRHTASRRVIRPAHVRVSRRPS